MWGLEKGPLKFWGLQRGLLKFWAPQTFFCFGKKKFNFKRQAVGPRGLFEPRLGKISTKLTLCGRLKFREISGSGVQFFPRTLRTLNFQQSPRAVSLCLSLSVASSLIFRQSVLAGRAVNMCTVCNRSVILDD